MEIGEIAAVAGAIASGIASGLMAGHQAGKRLRKRAEAEPDRPPNLSVAPGHSGGVTTVAVTQRRVDQLERDVAELKARPLPPDLTDLRDRVETLESDVRELRREADELARKHEDDGKAIHQRLDKIQARAKEALKLLNRMREDR